MKPITSRFILVFAILFFASVTTLAQTTSSSTSKSTTTEMKTYLIEREIPGAGKLTPEQLKSISQTSCNVLKEMAPHIEWIHSYVTDDKIYCVYQAPDEATVKKHADESGFPANKISRVRSMMDPSTAEA